MREREDGPDARKLNAVCTRIERTLVLKMERQQILFLFLNEVCMCYGFTFSIEEEARPDC